MPGNEWPDDNERINYPIPETSDQKDDFHGTVIADPYRHLEDSGSPATKAWVAAQDRLAQRLLAGLPARPAIEARLAEIWSQPSPGIPYERGGRWFQRRRPAGAEQDVLYAGESADGCDRILLDPAGFSADGSATLVNVSVSPDGSAVAYSVSESGSDWQTWHVRDAASAADLGDRVSWSKLNNAVWHPDGSGFFYTRLAAPQPGQELTAAEHGSQVCFHRSGTSQEDDTEVLAPDDDELWPTVSLSTDGRYLIVSLSRGLGSGAELRILELAQPSSGFRVLLPADPAERTVVATRDDVFYVLTDDNADRRRIMAVHAAGSAHGQCRDVVPECPDTLLEAHFFGGRLVCHYLRDACSVLKVFELDGSPAGEIDVPELCTLSGSHLTERVFVRSDDGTRVPLFLTRRRHLPRDGDARVLLYGYGGVGASFTPAFRADWVTWIERGGMFALASLRGGGEYGSSWYRDGRRDRKQNVFDDFAACLRWLVSSGWSRPSRIAITGGSNGGLLVGACLTQHPELSGAAVAQAGVFDMLRFHLFTDGWSWKPEYGDPDHPAESRWLAAYSPLHNTRPGRYPATLLTTGDHDDRVVPSHALKFGAALQAAQTAPAPVLIRVYSHIGQGMPAISKVVAEQADSLAFLEAALTT